MSDPAGRYEPLPTFSRTLDDGRAVVLRQPRIVPPRGAAGTPAGAASGGGGAVPGGSGAASASPAVPGRVTVGAGDRVDTLAARLLGDPYAWWRLADANPTVPVDGLDDNGRVLDLPREPG